MKIPTQRRRNRVPNPMKMDATVEIINSFFSSRVNFVEVTLKKMKYLLDEIKKKIKYAGRTIQFLNKL